VADASPVGGAGGSLARQLRELRLERDNPPYRLISSKTGLSTGHISDVLRGTTVPSWDHLQRLVEYLNGDVPHFRTLWLNLKNEDADDVSWGASHGTSEPDAAPSLWADVSVFISLTPADDDSTFGNIVKFVEQVSRVYHINSGRRMRLFTNAISTDASEGDNWDAWKNRIRLGLSSSTIFLVFISPTYLRDPVRRWELSLIRSFLYMHSASHLLLPLLYAGRPNLSDPELADTLPNQVLEQSQWLDISDVLDNEPDSRTWRSMTRGVASRIDQILAGAAPYGLEIDDHPDISEHKTQSIHEFALIEQPLNQFKSNGMRAAHVVEELIDDLPGHISRLRSAQTYRELLSVSTEAVKRIRLPAREIAAASRRISVDVDESNSSIKRLLEAERAAFPVQNGIRADLLKRFSREPHRHYPRFRQIVKLYNTASEASGYSGDLDRLVQAIQLACLILLDQSGTIEIWHDEIAAMSRL
jgi:transcriptional regulator with XRE-family HTH domain